VTQNDLEISIAQYLDGSLADEPRIALEARLAQDPAAQALLEEERVLTELLRSQPLPEIRWDRLTDSISSAIDQELEERMAQASWWLRMRSPAGLAMAASVLLAIGLSFYALMQSGQTSAPNPVETIAHSQTAMLMVEGPQSDRPDGDVVSQITVAAGGSYAKDSSLNPYADEIDSRPSRVVIASGAGVEASRLGFPN
jgi:hypothetical protein